MSLFDSISVEEAKKLIVEGANIEARDRFGQTPLLFSLYMGNIEVAKYLIENGANLEVEDNEGINPIGHVIYQSCDFVKLLLSKIEKNRIHDYINHTPVLMNNLCDADCYTNDVYEKVKFLLKNGAEVNYVHDDAFTPLMDASQWGNLDMVKLYVENGAIIDAKGSDGRTALSYAAESSHTNVMKFLIENGANVNEKDKDGRSVLEYAFVDLYGDDTEILELLIKNGVDLQEIFSNGNTPLKEAEESGPKLVELIKCMQYKIQPLQIRCAIVASRSGQYEKINPVIRTQFPFG